jgi:hypothetical protein
VLYFVYEDVLEDKSRHLDLLAKIAVFKLLHVWKGWLGLRDGERRMNTLQQQEGLALY